MDQSKFEIRYKAVRLSKLKLTGTEDFPESQTKAIPYFPSQVELEGGRQGNSGASESYILDVDLFN